MDTNKHATLQGVMWTFLVSTLESQKTSLYQWKSKNSGPVLFKKYSSSAPIVKQSVLGCR